MALGAILVGKESGMVTQSLAAHVEGAELKPAADFTWVGEIPALGAARCPTRTALHFAERQQPLTYADLDHDSRAFAAMLQNRGIGAGDRIAYLGRNSDLFFPVLFGSIRAQCILVPLNWRLAVPEIRYQLQHSGTRFVICDAEFAAAVRQSARDLGATPDIMLTEDDGNDAGLRSVLRAMQPPVQDAAFDPDRTILLLYTSGTTGNPKGVQLTHRALSLARHAELSSPDLAHLEPGCVLASPMPNFHIGGISWVLMGLVRFGTVYVTGDSSAPGLLKLLWASGARHIFTVASVIRGIVDELHSSRAAAPALAGMYYGAMPMDERLVRDAMDLFGCRFVQFFGMTENGGSASLLGPADHDLSVPGRLKSVGKPYPGMSLEIRGPERQLLRRGEHGEIWVRSPTLTSGYWNMPEQTRAAIIDGWYATGDGGYLDESGYLFLTDRIKDMIVSGGENVYPVEVEQVLRGHEAVLDAAVVGEPDERWGERVVAYVQLRPGLHVDAEALQGFARQHIAAFKCPKAIRFVSELPRTASGKVQRARLREADTVASIVRS